MRRPDSDTALCDMFNVAQANKVGMDGPAVKKTLCDIASGNQPSGGNDGGRQPIVPVPPVVVST